jgi:hypothetical protein
MRTLDFTPSDSSFPIKLPSLRSCDTFRSLPTQLLSGTLRNLSVLKNLSQLYLTAAQATNSFFIPPLKRGGLSNFNRFCKVSITE